jgi:hypothetical protein
MKVILTWILTTGHFHPSAIRQKNLWYPSGTKSSFPKNQCIYRKGFCKNGCGGQRLYTAPFISEIRNHRNLSINQSFMSASDEKWMTYMCLSTKFYMGFPSEIRCDMWLYNRKTWVLVYLREQKWLGGCSWMLSFHSIRWKPHKMSVCSSSHKTWAIVPCK